MPCKDETWMLAALEQARSAGVRGDLPVGAVVVANDRALAGAGNEACTSGDPTAHAEVVALRRLGKSTRTRADGGISLYTTFEPCPMCLGAALVLGVNRIVIGGRRPPGDTTWGAYTPELLVQLTTPPLPTVVEYGPFSQECTALRSEGVDRVVFGIANRQGS